MKKLFAILLSALMLVYMMPLTGLQAKAAEKPTISATETTALPGEKVTIDLNLANNTGIGTLAVRIAYDSANLKITDTKNGSVFPESTTTFQESVTLDANPYVCAWMNTGNSNITTNGKLFSVTFEVSEGATFCSCTIGITVREAYDISGNPILIDTVNGAIYVTPTTDHTVVFKDWDGKVLSTQTVAHGKAAQAPQNPYREGYTFTGWDRDFSNVTEDMEIKALYDVLKHTVTFKGLNDVVISKVEVEHGKAANAPQPPTVEGYEFICWDRDFSCVMQDMTVKAQYDRLQFAVLFIDYDNMPIMRVIVEYGEAANAPIVPGREGYTFTGWDKDFSHVTENMTVQAQYTINTYTVSYFVDGELYTTQSYEYGQDITPAQAPTGDGTFSGWSEIPETMPAHNVNVYGTFTELFTVVFQDWDGTPLSVQQVNPGEAAVAPEVTPREGYNFTGWDKDFSEVTENMTVTAQYELKKFIVRFYDWDDTFLGESETEWGMSASAPAIPGREGYKFSGWDKDISCIKEDMSVKALYVVAKCYVTFIDADGTLLDTQAVDYGANAVPPQVIPPVGYEFAGWDKPYTNITENVTIQAQYKEQVFTVTFKDMGGATLSTQQVGYGKAATAPASTPSHEGYMFKGWDKDFSYIVSNLTVNAMFAKCWKVTFFDTVANEVIEVQSVEQNSSASAPKAPEHEGYTFSGWDKVFAYITADITVNAIYDMNAVIGDANGDGKINTSDAVIVLKYAAGMVQLDDTQFIAANTNKDDKVNTSDAVLILKYAAGMITGF